MELEFRDYLRLGLYLLYCAEREYFCQYLYKRIAYSR